MSATHTDLTTPDQITAETKPGSIFEKATCSRCGGSGSYGPRQVIGGRCFKCLGSGVVYTKRGAETRRYFLALGQTTVAGLRVGDRIHDAGMEAGGMVFQAAGWHTVEDIIDVAAEPERASSSRLLRASELDKIEAAAERGATIRPYAHDLDGEKAVQVWEGYSVRTTGLTVGMSGEQRVRVSDPETQVARMKAAAEYQLALTKTGKPRKGSRYDVEAAA